MTTHRFDALTKSFATTFSRRSALRSTGIGLAAGIVGTSGLKAAAQEATPAAAPSVDGAVDATFYFVQTATSGTFAPNPGAGTPEVAGTPTPGGGAEYLLTLEGHHGGTIYFSDRPERIVGQNPTEQFLEGFGFGPENPPNAAVVVETEDGEQDVVVLELLNPTYDEASGTLTYGATILEEYQGENLVHLASQQQDTELPESFSRASLFIDDCPDDTLQCAAPGSGGVFRYPGNTRNKYGYCWDAWTFQCKPCDNETSIARAQADCNARYPNECQGKCGVVH